MKKISSLSNQRICEFKQAEYYMQIELWRIKQTIRHFEDNFPPGMDGKLSEMTKEINLILNRLKEISGLEFPEWMT